MYCGVWGRGGYSFLSPNLSVNEERVRPLSYTRAVGGGHNALIVATGAGTTSTHWHINVQGGREGHGVSVDSRLPVADHMFNHVISEHLHNQSSPAVSGAQLGLEVPVVSLEEIVTEDPITVAVTKRFGDAISAGGTDPHADQVDCMEAFRS